MSEIENVLFGNTVKMQKALKTAESFALKDHPVVIVGEIGVGKKILSQYIHNLSSRKDQPLIIVNCHQENDLVQNELLGYREQGSGKFIKGALENANGGTVVLENIDSLEEKLQYKIHKIFEELEDYDINLKIIATTTKNLSKLVGAGRFYRALYVYFSPYQISISPLRERMIDINIFLDFYINKFCKQFEKSKMEISDKSKQKIINHYWTHNIEEFSNVIENAVRVNDSEVIDVDMLNFNDKKNIPFGVDDSEDGFKLMSLKEAEKILIKKALIHTSENRTQAAKILGVSIRTLRNKINEYRNEGLNYFLNLR